MASRSGQVARRERIVVLALGGQSPRTLAEQFGVPEWSIRRWLGHARRRQQSPYWRQINGGEPRKSRGTQ